MSMIPQPEKKDTPEVYMVPCPNCGTVHQVTKWTNTYHYLDGVHKIPIDKWAQRYVVCVKCGILYGKAHNPLVINPKVMENTAYRCLSQNTEMSHEEKVVLMLIQECAYNAPLWERLLPHVYAGKDAEKYIQALCQVERNILTHKERPARLLECGSLHWKYGWFGLYPEVRLIDIYRQMGEWEKAKQQIAYVRQKEYFEYPDQLFDYLKLENKLIKRRDNTIQ